jgi:biotin carboxyl carrier protein
MTGVIKEIRVSVGHNVQKGQVVLVMEAMKMDIDVPTPTAGIVAEVSVRAGESVSAKQQLLVVH